VLRLLLFINAANKIKLLFTYWKSFGIIIVITEGVVSQIFCAASPTFANSSAILARQECFHSKTRLVKDKKSLAVLVFFYLKTGTLKKMEETYVL